MKRLTWAFVVLCLGFFALVSIASGASEKPDVILHEGTYLDRALNVHVQWQSTEPVVQVTISAGQHHNEVRVDEQDNRRIPSGYEGEITAVLPVDAAMFQQAISYVVQLKDELGRKSNLVNGRVPLAVNNVVGQYNGQPNQHGDGWGKEHLQGGYQKPVGGDIMDKLLTTQERHDIAPTMDSLQPVVNGMTVLVRSRANDDKGLREISFRLFDSTGTQLKAETLSGLGKIWQGSSPVFTLPVAGMYRIVAQAFDSAGNSSREQSTTFNAGIVKTPVSGVCDVKHYNCKAGTSASNQEFSDKYQWKCVGLNQGATVDCTEAKEIPPGKCGAAANTCIQGIPSGYDQTKGTWICSGNPPASCTVAAPGVCDVKHYNCKAGTSASNQEFSDKYQWKCVGLNQGVTVDCTEAKEIPPGKCGAAVNTCIQGIPSGYDQTKGAWTCSGNPPALCQIGKCGSADGVPTLSKPDSGLCVPPVGSVCQTIMPITVVDAGLSWKWKCCGITDDCEAPKCQSDKVFCNNQCIDTKTDKNNCGACGKACNAGQTCQNGVCKDQCTTGTVFNCSTCGDVCQGVKQCVNNKCVCPAEYEEYNNGCRRPTGKLQINFTPSSCNLGWKVTGGNPLKGGDIVEYEAGNNVTVVFMNGLSAGDTNWHRPANKDYVVIPNQFNQYTVQCSCSTDTKTCPNGARSVERKPELGCEFDRCDCPPGQTIINGSCTIPCQAGQIIYNSRCVTCIPGTTETKDCSIANGRGNQSRTCNSNGNWDAWGSCQIICNNGYELFDGKCVTKKICTPGAVKQKDSYAISGGTKTCEQKCSTNGLSWEDLPCRVSCTQGYSQVDGRCELAPVNPTCEYRVPGECSSSGVAIWRSSDISSRTVSATNNRAQLNFIIENGGEYTWSRYKFMVRSVDNRVCLDKNNGSLQPEFSAAGGGGSTIAKLDIDVPKVKNSYFVVLDIVDTKQNCRLKSPAKTVNGRTIDGPIGFYLVVQ